MNSFTGLPKNFIGELERITGMFFIWFLEFKLSGSTLIAKKYFPDKIDQVRD